jgi:excisionase family DNA binding protein
MSARTRAAVAATHTDIPRVGYDMTEVAAALGVGYETALKMRKEKAFPSFRAGREWRVHPDHLNDAIKALAERGTE